MRVLLADDHPIFREGLRALLEDAGCTVVAQAGNGREAVDLVAKFEPDVAVLDLSMPLVNGIDAGRAIAARAGRTKVVLLTVHREDHYVLAALRAGITGYVLKTQAATDLLTAMHEVASGAVYLSPGVSQAVLESARRPETSQLLTPRERQVLRLIAEGKSTKEVGVALGISVKTADSHRTRLMEKLDIHDVASLVRYAIREGLVQP
jgi:DNA-binding NarL/FixJ family response regulator